MVTKFYVYAYLRKDNSPYYIGKGIKERAYRRRGRIISPPRDRKRIVFLRTGLSEDEAFEWERFYIKHYGRIDLGTGILRNATDGGDGTSNPGEEVKKKYRENGKRAAERNHKEKNANGKSIFAVEAAKNLNKEKDENGKSVNAVKGGNKGAAIMHAQKWEDPDHPELGKQSPGNLVRMQKRRGLPHEKENRRKVVYCETNEL
jgi:hypothetical protein